MWAGAEAKDGVQRHMTEGRVKDEGDVDGRLRLKGCKRRIKSVDTKVRNKEKAYGYMTKRRMDK